MTLDDVYAYIARQRVAVIATVHANGGTEAALVGFAVTGTRNLVFDTDSASRKAVNLRVDDRVAMVIGWDDETSVQLEGRASMASGQDRAAALADYLRVWPDGRERLADPAISHFIVRPHWLRFSRYAPDVVIQEFEPVATPETE